MVHAAATVDTERGEFHHGHVPPPVPVRPAAGLASTAAAQRDAQGLENLTLRAGAAAFASSALPGHAIHQIAHLNDGKLGNSHSWIAGTPPPAWAGVDLGGVFHVCRVALGSDSSGQYHDRAPLAFAVQTALDTNAWETACIGCHESRLITPTRAYLNAAAMKRPPAEPQPPPWGAGPFWFERVIQPVLDKRCVSCHNDEKPNRCNLAGRLDAESVPVSYRSLLSSGAVYYFDYGYQAGVPYKAEAYTFGTLNSRLWEILQDANHRDIALTPDERHALTCWIDLNVPLWGDYAFRPERKTIRPQDLSRWKP